MYCTVCEKEVADVGHYRLKLHAINVKRKISGFRTPISESEVAIIGLSGPDFLIDLCHNHESASEPESLLEDEDTPRRSRGQSRPLTFKECMCMGLSREQATYISNRQCYICYEGFATTQLLFKHVREGKHRSAVTDGVSLYLMNGVVLHPDKRKIASAVVAPKGALTGSPENERNDAERDEIKYDSRWVRKIHSGTDLKKKWRW